MFTGTMPTPDVKNYADKVGLTLSLRDGRLIGEALAFNTQDFDPYAFSDQDREVLHRCR